MGVPARLTTASTSASSAGSIRRCWGSQRCSSAVRGVRRTSRSTSCPSDRRAATRRVPISPEEPVTATFICLLQGGRDAIGAPAAAGAPIGCGSGEAELAVELAGLQALLDRAEEAGRVGAVDDPVVVGQRQV